MKKLRGFREFYPEEMRMRRKIFSTLVKVVESYGFEEVDTPSVEPLELFTLKSGEEIVNETFSFADKGGRKVTLIPELTPSIARMISEKKMVTKPLKWYSFPKIWRYEEPQSGRLREFRQLNVDIFGVPTVNADAELIALSVDMLKTLNLGSEFVIKISDRRLLELVLKICGIEPEKVPAVCKAIDKRSKIDETAFTNLLLSEGLSEKSIKDLKKYFTLAGSFEERLDELQKLIPAVYRNTPLADLKKLASLLTWYGVEKYCTLDLSVVRGLDYYTSIVFECYDIKGELRAMFGGGRYDELIALLGGLPTPATGFAMGDAVLEILLQRTNQLPAVSRKTDYFIAADDAKYEKIAIEIASSLRAKGLVVEYDLLGRSLSKQLKYADKICAANTILLCKKEVSAGNLILRDMNTGEQKIISIDAFLNSV